MVVTSFKSGLPAATPATKHRGKEIREIIRITTIRIVIAATAERMTTFRKRVAPCRCLLSSGLFKLLGMFPVLPVLVVLFPFFRIAQYFVCFIKLLEKPRCFGVIGVQVGVMLACQFSIRLFNFVCC